MSPSAIIAAYNLLFLPLFSVCLFGFIVVRRLVLERRQARFARIYKRIENDVEEQSGQWEHVGCLRGRD